MSARKHGAKIATASHATGSIALTIRAQYVTVEGFEITGGQVALGVTASHVTVKGNRVHDVHKRKPDSNGGAGIDVYTNDYGPLTDVVVDGNLVYDVGLEVAGSQTVQGIYIAIPCTGCKVINNIVHSIEDFGIHAYHNPQHWLVANNTVFNCGRGILIGQGFTVVNNISYRNRGNGYQITSAFQSAPLTFSNNLSFGNGNNAARDGVTVADPKFVNPVLDGSGDYHLQPGPALNGGTTSGAPAWDYEGQPRPQGSANDIGAYEQ